MAFGRPKGHRRSYKQWGKDNTPPHVVFEILSPSNYFRPMLEKFRFYERYGVQEYYQYDPETGVLEGGYGATARWSRWRTCRVG
ncbi:MAG: Uma2 family endonuclease [Armatimonadota bacterium]